MLLIGLEKVIPSAILIAFGMDIVYTCVCVYVNIEYTYISMLPR